MIKELSLTRFQAHDKTRLCFRPGVNLIVGESDSGKSAILRGLRWLVFNRPSGFTFQSHWAAKGEDTAVEVALSDGNVVRRVRNKKDNQYLLSTLEEPLEAVRTEVPAEVLAATRMDELNVQRQGDKPFLLDESPAEVARVLNTVAGLDGIDAAHTRVAAKVRENQGNQRVTNGHLDIVTYQLAAYDGLATLQAKVDAHVRQQGALKAQREAVEALGRLIIEAEEATARLKTTAGVEALDARCRKLETSRLAIAEQAGVVLALEALTTDVGRLKYRLAALPKENVAALTEELERLTVVEQEQCRERMAVDALKVLGMLAANQVKTVEEDAKQQAAIEARLSSYNTCPECGAEKRYWK